jgi:hypothetical protein
VGCSLASPARFVDDDGSDPTPSAVALAALLVLAGCSAGPQNRQVTGRGTPATLSPATLDEAGLHETRSADRTLRTRVETTVSGNVAVQTAVEVNVTTPVYEYRRDDIAVGVVSTPAVRPVEGRGAFRDALAELPVDEQVAYAQSRYGTAELGDGERVRNATLLGTETPLLRFPGTASGRPVTGFLTRAKHGDDFVTLVVVAPAGRDTDVAGLVAGLEH